MRDDDDDPTAKAEALMRTVEAFSAEQPAQLIPPSFIFERLALAVGRDEIRLADFNVREHDGLRERNLRGGTLVLFTDTAIIATDYKNADVFDCRTANIEGLPAQRKMTSAGEFTISVLPVTAGSATVTLKAEERQDITKLDAGTVKLTVADSSIDLPLTPRVDDGVAYLRALFDVVQNRGMP
jgi:hypothetical protein